MKTVFRIFLRDLKRLSRNRAAALVMVGVCLLPSLYAWFNIAANMDPYGNTAGIKVAIANCDRGASSDIISLNAGDTIVQSLKKNDQLGWVFVDEKKAKEGVRSGKYYAAIVIPDDFSNSLLSVLSGEIKDPKLDYYINEKKNAIAPKITDTGATTIQQEINDTFSAVASEAISKLIQKAANQMSADLNSADADLMNTIQNVRNNLADYQKTIDSFKKTVAGSKPVLQDAIASLDDVDSAAKGASDAFSNTQKLFQQARDGLQDFSGALTGGLSGSEAALTNFSVTSGNRLGALETTGSQVSAALDDNIAAAEKLQQKNQKLIQSLDALQSSTGGGSDLSQQISDIKGQTQSYTDLLNSLKSGKKTIDGAVSYTHLDRLDQKKSVLKGTPDTSWFDYKNPKKQYQITSEEQLMGLASLVNEEQASRWKPTRTETFEGVTFKLTKDIKLTGEWTPIGMSESICFAGSFDGNGHTISNVIIKNNADSIGFFGYLKGEVKDLNLSGSIESTGGECGGVAGSLDPSASVTGCSAAMDINAGKKTGGIVGSSNGGKIENCVNRGNVSGTYKVGGVVGENFGGTVKKCGNEGNVSSSVRGEMCIRDRGKPGQRDRQDQCQGSPGQPGDR